MLKLKLHFGHLMQRTNSFEKTLMLGKSEDRRRGRQKWGGWMASPTRWTWIWVNWSWWWTGRPGVLQSMGSQRVGHSWATELNWPDERWELAFLPCEDNKEMSATCFPVAQTVKNLPATQEACVWFVGPEDPLKEGMSMHFSIPAWRTPWTEDPHELWSMELQRAGLNRATKHISANWERTLIRALPGWPLYLGLPASRTVRKFWCW